MLSWDPEDIDKAVAYELAMREVCKTCGTRPEDYRDDDGEPHDPPRLEAVVRRCHWCAQTTKLRLAIEDQARREAGTGEDASMAASRELAGLAVALVTFDPDRPLIEDD